MPHNSGRSRKHVAAVATSAVLAGLVLAGFPAAASASAPEKPIPSADLKNANAVYSYLVGEGFTKVEASGVIGNLVAESNVNPKAVEGAGVSADGQGIAQWSLNGSRWAAVKRVAAKDGVSPYTLLPQEQWLATELKTDNYNSAFTHEAACGNSAADVACAAYAIEHYYEVPNETTQTTLDREGWAEGEYAEAPAPVPPPVKPHPSTAVLPNGNLAVAFPAAGTGKLWTWNGARNTAGNGTATNDGVAPGTSPSIAVLPNGNLAVAFQAAGTGKLWTWTGAPNSAGNGTATADGMAAGTSPSIAVLPDGKIAVAFHAAGGGLLWTWTGAPNSGGNGTATADGMAAGTSPSITVLPNGNLAVAFQANGGKLWTWNGAPNSGGNGTATADGVANDLLLADKQLMR